MIVSRGAQNRLPESQRINKSVWGFGVRVLSSLLAHFMLYTLISLFTKHFLTIQGYSLDWSLWDVGLSGIIWRVLHLNWGRRCKAIAPTDHICLPKILPRGSFLVCICMISYHFLLSKLSLSHVILCFCSLLFSLHLLNSKGSCMQQQPLMWREVLKVPTTLVLTLVSSLTYTKLHGS